MYLGNITVCFDEQVDSPPEVDHIMQTRLMWVQPSEDDDIMQRRLHVGEHGICLPWQ